MNNYVDFSKYPSDEVLKMLREKQKEYIILIQSEKIAKRIMNYYGKDLYTSNYHSRVNNEYYLLYERATKKNLISNDNNDVIVGIPYQSIIARLIESQDEVLKNDKDSYYEYRILVDKVADKIKKVFYGMAIIYKNGYLYMNNGNEEEILLDNEFLDNAFNDENNVLLKKRKH